MSFFSVLFFLMIDEDAVVSRTTDCLRCLEVLEAGRQTLTLPILNHSFEEVSISGNLCI